MAEKKKGFLLDLIIFVLAVYPTYSAFRTFLRCVGYYFGNVTNWIGIILAYAIGTAFCFAYFKNKYANPASKPGCVIFLVLMIILEVASIAMIIMNIDLYLTNLTYHSFSAVFPFDVFILLVSYIIADILLIRDIKKNNYREKTNKGFGRGLLRILFFISMFLIMFETWNFIVGLGCLELLGGDHAVYFCLLMIMQLLPLIDLFFIYMERRTGKFVTAQKVMAVLGICFVVLLTVAQIIEPNFMVIVGKMFFPLDFFGSIVMGQVMLIYTNLTPLCCLIFRKKKK